ncbi:MAG: beta-eliminating lyase-related protein [Actinomycetota bacterium]|nr:beta-eliminating lyase-related protein [Actinomycetota bacterium]
METDLSAQEEQALRASCTRFLYGHGFRSPADLLSELPDEIAPDRYGEGGVVAELEAEVATLLGKPAGVFLPSGTMAQQITLRVHADRRGSRTVVFHPTCHLDVHEGKGYERLHGLVGRPAGDAHRLLALEDLQGVAERPAALLLELPQREIGGPLPAWDDLVAQVEWAHGRGAAVHMDGARLWGCGPFYQRTLAEIAEPFDTVYVSFYKQLGGITGSCVAGPEDIVAEVREWRRRHGGTLFALWPYAASALASMRRRLPSMPRYVEHARAIAAAVGDLPGLEVVPDPPPAGTMHLLLHAPADRLRAASLRLAREDGIWTWPRPEPTAAPGVQEVELEVGDATLEFDPAEVRDVLEVLLA